jgi:hypothetical protein
MKQLIKWWGRGDITAISAANKYGYEHIFPSLCFSLSRTLKRIACLNYGPKTATRNKCNKMKKGRETAQKGIIPRIMHNTISEKTKTSQM